MNKPTFQRDELYKEIWSTPMNQLAQQYDITVYQLGKVCNALDIPMPPRGYWIKVQHGIKVEVTKLPASDKDSYSLSETDKVYSKTKMRHRKKKISVHKRLYNPHPLVKATRANLKAKQLNKYNRVEGYPLDVTVAPESVDRALRIMDAILKKLQQQGREVHPLKSETNNRMYIDCNDEQVFIQLREKGTRKKQKRSKDERRYSWNYDSYEYIPTGELKLLISDSELGFLFKAISDTKTIRLEDRLDEFFEWLDIMGERIHTERLKREEWHRQREIEMRNEEAAESQHERELERIRRLEKQADLFTRSHYIYEFINAIEKQKVILELDSGDRQKLDAWIHWAWNHADHMNPVKKVMESLLENGVE